MPAPVAFGGQIFLNNSAHGFDPTSAQYVPRIAANASGQLAIIWNNTTTYEWVITSSDENAVSFGNGTFANALGNISGWTDVIAATDGSFIFGYVSGTGSASEITIARKYNGLQHLTANPPTLTYTLANAQNQFALAPSPDGGFMFSYTTDSDNAGNFDVYRQSYNPQHVSDLSGVTQSGTGVQELSDITLLANGNSVMTWVDRNTNTIKFLRMDGQGYSISSIGTVANETVYNGDSIIQSRQVSVTGLSDGGFVIEWLTSTSSPSRFAIYNSDGSVRVAPTNSTLNGFGTQVLGLADGRFVMVTGNYGIKGQIFSANGVPDGEVFTVPNTGNGGFHPSLALLPDGRFVISYSVSGLTGGSDRDIAMNIYDPREAGVTVAGTQNNDQYYGSAYNDTLLGAAGNDILEGRNGDDILNGGIGTDTLRGGEGNDRIIGGFGGDTIDGGNGIDTADYSQAGSGIYLLFGDLTHSTGEAAGDSFTDMENLIGTNFGDILGFGEGDNKVWGGAGNDQIYGQGGDDILIGGAGSDYLDGGAGTRDLASYEDSTSGVYVVFSDLGGSSGEAAGDTFVGIEGLVGSAYNDTLWMDGNANFIYGGGGNDNLSGFGGDDYLDGGSGQDQINGGLGIDTASYQSATTGGVYYLFGDVGNAQGDALGDVYTSIENLTGSNFRDIVGIGEGDNVLRGMGGNDWLLGQGGNDTLLGGTGADLLDGGTGNDTASYAEATSGIYLFMGDLGAATGEAAGDSFVSIENIVGTAFDDIIGWDSGNNAIYGGAGNDKLYGMGGNDTLDGGAGNDLYAYTGAGFGNDTVTLFEDGADKIDFRQYAGLTFANLLINASVGGVTVTVGSDTIFLGGVTIGQITSADFLFA